MELTKPSKIVWIDGSKEQIDALKAEAVETGEMIKLNEELLPDCYLHRTAENDVARVEDRTLICSKKEEDAGPTNHWMEPSKAYKMLYDIAAGAYEGRTMYIIPYSMGPVGSPFSKVGIEITDSIYVVLNMNIMTRVGKAVLDVLGDSNGLGARYALQVQCGSGEALDLPVPGGQHHHFRELCLRRQCAAGQKKSASLCVSLLTWVRTRCGRLSIC